MNTTRMDFKIVLLMVFFLGIGKIALASGLGVEHYCKLGKSLYEEGRYKQSMQAFSRALLIDPSCEMAKEYMSKSGIDFPKSLPRDIVSENDLLSYILKNKTQDAVFSDQPLMRRSSGLPSATAFDAVQTKQLQQQRNLLKKKLADQERQFKTLEAKLHSGKTSAQGSKDLTGTQSLQKIQYAFLKNKSDLTKAQRRIENYENLLERKNKELNEKNSELSLMKQQSAGQKLPARKANVDQEQMKQLMKKYNGEVIALKEKLTQNNTLYQKEIGVYQQKVNLLEKQLNAYQQESKKNQANKKTEAKADKPAKVDKKQAALAKVKINKSIAALKQEIGEFKKKLEDQKQEIKIRTDIIQDQNKKLASLEDELNKEHGPSQEKDKIISDLKRQLSQQEQLNELSEESIQERDLQIKQLSDELNQLKRKIDS